MSVHPLDPAQYPLDEKTPQAYRDVLKQIVDFRNARGWEASQTPANLAKSLAIEASEVLQVFQWDENLPAAERAHLAEELADVLTYTYYLCDRLAVDPLKLVAAKNRINQSRHWDE